MFQHTITNTVWKWSTMRLMHAHAFLQRIIVFFNCDLQTGDDAEKSEGVLNFSMIVLKQKSLKFWRLPNVNSVNWISSFKLSKFKVVQRYNVAFRFLYVYTSIHTSLFVKCVFVIHTDQLVISISFQAGQVAWWFLMDMCFLCVFWN